MLSIKKHTLLSFSLALVSTLITVLAVSTPAAHAASDVSYKWVDEKTVKIDYTISAGTVSAKKSAELKGSYPNYTASSVTGDGTSNPMAALAGCSYNVNLVMTSDASKGKVTSTKAGASDSGCSESLFDGEVSLSNTEAAPEDRSAGVDSDEIVDDNPTTCVVDGAGWLVCTVARVLAQAMDGIYSVIASFLVVTPLSTDTGDDNGLFTVWETSRSLANVAFIIAFLVIIFSHLSSWGVSNYSIKKMLPRLIVSAILVNISYWIAAVAVDLSNILGVATYDVLEDARDNIGNVSLGNQWELALDTLLAGGALAVSGGAIYAATAAVGTATVGTAALWIALPAVLGAILAALVAVAILAARHALIVVLIVLAPLAFVAFLLPNTERLFNLWRKSLVAMLVFYPLFSLIFGGAQLASLIILTSLGNSETQEVAGHMVILALFIQVAPLIVLPKIMAIGGGLIGKFAGMVNNKNRGLIDRSRKVRDRKMGNVKAGMRNGQPLTYRRGPLKGRRTTGGLIQSAMMSSDNNRRTDEAQSKALEGDAVNNWAQSLTNKTEEELSAQNIHPKVSVTATAVVERAELEDIKDTASYMKNQLHLTKDEYRALSRGEQVKRGDRVVADGGSDLSTQVAAMQAVVNSGDMDGINQMWNAIGASGDSKKQTMMADALAASGNRPGWIGQGALATMRTAGQIETDDNGNQSVIKPSSAEDLMKSAIVKNAYGADRIATGDDEELRTISSFVQANQSSPNESDRIGSEYVSQFASNASAALEDPILSKKITKNIGAVKGISSIQSTPTPATTANPTPPTTQYSTGQQPSSMPDSNSTTQASSSNGGRVQPGTPAFDSSRIARETAQAVRDKVLTIDHDTPRPNASNPGQAPTPAKYMPSTQDIKNMTTNEINMVINSAGGTHQLTDTDIARGINATHGQSGMEEIHNKLRAERAVRQGVYSDGRPPQAPPPPNPGP